MSVCTFFGHRDAPSSIEPILRSTIIDLIENKDVRLFYVGNQGGFDSMVRRNLKRLKSDYPKIDYAVVLAYMPIEKKDDYLDYSDTIYPQELANVPKKFAIDKRNRLLIDKADFVITYVTHSIGGAAKFKVLAEKNGKTIINIT